MGVSFDAPEDNRAFKEKFDFPYDLLTDVQKSMSIAYGAADDDSARPSRVSVLIGPDGKVAASYATVKPADHPDEVLSDLNRLS
jgi:peroxiredoxin Q/BCP